ncbi:hypothetical protein M5K25_019843 [Dendrobium thyrsiflorum]|uniref:Uncharacterized protein n=1 Tax=Dendrobium thyrsiflorum TaxID=117978 RepID=A0ABD0UG22_DENTH
MPIQPTLMLKPPIPSRSFRPDESCHPDESWVAGGEGKESEMERPPPPVNVVPISRRGTCPLTGGFAAKWHRRINGYDSGPSEPGDSPPNGITKLWLWPAPVNIQPRSTRYPWTKQPMAADKDPSVRGRGANFWSPQISGDSAGDWFLFPSLASHLSTIIAAYSIQIQSLESPRLII